MLDAIIMAIITFALGFIVAYGIFKAFVKSNGVLYIYDDKVEVNFVDGYEELCRRKEVILEVQVRKS